MNRGRGFTQDGWLDGVARCPSPNCDARPEGMEIELAVIHAISLPPDEFGGDGVERLFTNRLEPDAHPYYAHIQALRVSSHFFIRRNGQLLQFVPIHARAWHAGASCWDGRNRCNDFSVGIELEGCDSLPFESQQYEVLADLVADLARACPLRALAGHSDIAPGRKTDPGPHFSWPRFAALLGPRVTVSHPLAGWLRERAPARAAEDCGDA